MEDAGVMLLPSPKKKKPAPAPEDGRVAAVVLKDTAEYRDWLTGLSERTLIPVASIVRDALAKWAIDRGLPGPPGSIHRSQRKIGDRKPEKGKGTP